MSKNQARKAYEKSWHEENRDKMRAYSKSHYQRNKEALTKKHAEHYAENKSDYAMRAKRNNLKRKYGISLELYDQLVIDQNNKCAICSADFIGKMKPCVDHNHITGAVRGLLCRPCNLALSVVENTEYVEKAKQYLAKQMK